MKTLMLAVGVMLVATGAHAQKASGPSREKIFQLCSQSSLKKRRREDLKRFRPAWTE